MRWHKVKQTSEGLHWGPVFFFSDSNSFFDPGWHPPIPLWNGVKTCSDLKKIRSYILLFSEEWYCHYVTVFSFFLMSLGWLVSEFLPCLSVIFISTRATGDTYSPHCWKTAYSAPRILSTTTLNWSRAVLYIVFHNTYWKIPINHKHYPEHCLVWMTAWSISPHPPIIHLFTEAYKSVLFV